MDRLVAFGLGYGLGMSDLNVRQSQREALRAEVLTRVSPDVARKIEGINWW
jgi:hypothetical protein